MILWGQIPTDPRETTLRGLLQALLNSDTHQEEWDAWFSCPEGSSLCLAELVRDYAAGVAAMLERAALLTPAEVSAACRVLEMDHGEGRCAFSYDRGLVRYSFADGHAVGYAVEAAGYRRVQPAPTVATGAAWVTLDLQQCPPHPHDVVAAATETAKAAVDEALKAPETTSALGALVDSLPGEDLGSTERVVIDCKRCGHVVMDRRDLRTVAKPCCTIYALASRGRVLEREPTTGDPGPQPAPAAPVAAPHERVLLCLEQQPVGLSVPRICEALHMPERGVRLALAELGSAGKVTQTRRGRTVLWCVAP